LSGRLHCAKTRTLQNQLKFTVRAVATSATRGEPRVTLEGSFIMLRRVSMFVLAAATLAAGFGCRSSCSKGWFTSSSHDPFACQLVGRPTDVVIGSPAVGGVPLTPGVGGDLPYPQPTDLIPRTGVPVPPAVPTPAPGEGGAAVLPVPKVAVPVKGY
jgi:hypothetical protein